MRNVFIGVLSGFVTFGILVALALPMLETSLSVIPILGIAVVTGCVVPVIYAKRRKYR